MRHYLYAAVVSFCLTSLFGSAAFAQGYIGNYNGTYTASQLPGQTLWIGIYFKQLNAHMMIAQYAMSSGIAGACSGIVNGNIATMTCRNTTPACSAPTTIATHSRVAM